MITSLSLENFKSFQKLDNLEIKPLTILLGKNSCGKSSIIQSLLLLKQTLEEEGDADLNVEGK
ncbi:AAA family ATPase [Acinetobacter baumannii]|nr:AAA family ATPase [Acinetobacter baumannii]